RASTPTSVGPALRRKTRRAWRVSCRRVSIITGLLIVGEASGLVAPHARVGDDDRGGRPQQALRVAGLKALEVAEPRDEHARAVAAVLEHRAVAADGRVGVEPPVFLLL